MKKMIKKFALVLIMMLVATSVATVVSVPQEVQAATKKPSATRLNCGKKNYVTIKYGGTTQTRKVSLVKNRIYTVTTRVENWCSKEKHPAAKGVKVYTYVPQKIAKGKSGLLYLGINASNADAKQYTFELKAPKNKDVSIVVSKTVKIKTSGKKARTLNSKEWANFYRWGAGTLLSKQAMPGKKSVYATVTYQFKVVEAKSGSSSPSKKPSSSKKPAKKKSDW